MATGGLAIPRPRWAVKALVFDKRLLVYAAAAGCIPLAFIIYASRLNDFFAYDDFFFLRAVRDHGFFEVMRRAFIFPKAKPFDEVTLFWRPSIDLYFYAMRPFGIHAQPYHAVNVLVHGSVAALGVLFIWRLSRSGVAGAVAGLLFVVAPTYDFAVSWISEVSELLGAAFTLGALISYHAYLTTERPRSIFIGTTFFFTVAAFLTKESTVTLVVLFPALAIAVPAADRRRTWGEVMWSLAPLVLLGATFGIAMEVHDRLSEGGRLHSFGLHMARNLWHYLKWMVYPYRPGHYLAAREAGAALFLATGVAAVILRQRALAFFFVWTIVALLPFVGFDEWIELRYTYLATLPFIAFVVCALVTAIERLPRFAVAPVKAVFAVAVLAVLIVTPMRTRDQQLWFAGEARGYETMIDGVRNLCGPLPPESHVYVLNPPYRDLYGLATPAEVNLYFDHVYGTPVTELPPLIDFVEHKCVIQYDAQTRAYARLK